MNKRGSAYSGKWGGARRRHVDDGLCWCTEGRERSITGSKACEDARRRRTLRSVDENGVDMTLIDSLSEMSPEARLRLNDRAARSVELLREAFADVAGDPTLDSSDPWSRLPAKDKDVPE